MFPSISEGIIRSESSSQSFERGLQLFNSGAVYDLTRQGNLLMGKCEGSNAPFYFMQVEIDAGGIQTADCSCPYDFGRLCKHLVGILLVAVHTPEKFDERKPIADLLENLNRDALIRLLEKLADSEPDLYDRIEVAVAVENTGEAKQKTNREKRKTEISEKTFRRQVKDILNGLSGYRRSEAYWIMGGMVKSLAEIEKTAVQFLEAGDAEAAITILMALLDETADAYEMFDDSDGELGAFLDELGQPLAEAILSAELSDHERQELRKRILPIVDELEDYGIEAVRDALFALDEGWEGLDGDDGEGGWGTDLTDVKLNILERQGQVDEFLEMCQEVGEYRRYVMKLLDLGRKEEALPAAFEDLSDADDAFIVAKRLRGMGELPEAIALGEHGLVLYGPKYELGIWLGPLEEAHGRAAEAILAYRAAFESRPTLELYQTLQRLAGANWKNLKPDLITILKDSYHSDVLADVYIVEKNWDAAMALTQKHPGSYDLLEKVADAVLPHRPEWVIKASVEQSDKLIEKTQSKYYPIAARWLQKAKKAYTQLNRPSDWQTYLIGLKAKYYRRPALQAELKKL